MSALGMFKTPAGILAVFAVGALGGGVAGAYVLAQPVEHTPRTVQVSQVTTPSGDSTATAATAKPSKRIAAPALKQPAKKTTTAKARSLVNTQPKSADEPTDEVSHPAPLNGGGGQPDPEDVPHYTPPAPLHP